jgi:hypothetical protein
MMIVRNEWFTLTPTLSRQGRGKTERVPLPLWERIGEGAKREVK